MDTENLRNNTFNGVVWKFTERFLAQFISLVVSIILARILDPDNYVAISVVSIFLVFANTIVIGGLNTALIQKKDADAKDYSSVLYASLVLAVCIYVILYFCSPIIAELFKRGELVSVIRVMGILLFLNSVKAVYGAYISSRLQFNKFFISTLISSLCSAIIGIIIAQRGGGVWALVFQQIVAGTLDTIILIKLAKLKLSFGVSFERLKQLFRYGSGIFAATIIGAVYDEVSPLVIGIKFNPANLSFYDKGKSFPSLLNSACNDTITAVLFPVIAKVQDDKERVLGFTRRFIQISSFLIFPLLIGLFCVAETFVSSVLSEKWLPATIYIRIFCASYLLNFVQTGNLQAIKAIGRSDIILRLEIIKKSIYSIVLIVMIVIAKTPVAIATIAAINAIVATIINTYPNKRLIGYKYRYQLMDILPNLMISIAMGIMVGLMAHLPLEGVWLLFTQVLCGALTYFVLGIVTRNKSLKYLFSIIRQIGRTKNEKSC